MTKIVDFERGSAEMGTMFLVIGGMLILWLIWELITGAIGSGVQEQRQQDYEMLQAGARAKQTPRPVNRGGVRNSEITF